MQSTCLWHAAAAGTTASLLYICCCRLRLLPTQASAEVAGAIWYPPVRSTLLLLSQLYRCIDARIFAGLANEAVAACTASVQVRHAV